MIRFFLKLISTFLGNFHCVKLHFKKHITWVMLVCIDSLNLHFLSQWSPWKHQLKKHRLFKIYCFVGILRKTVKIFFTLLYQTAQCNKSFCCDCICQWWDGSNYSYISYIQNLMTFRILHFFPTNTHEQYVFPP